MSSPVFLITGASTGIGAATARAATGAGFRVVLAARSADKLDALADELGGEQAALALPTDVTDFAAQEAMVQTTLERFGRDPAKGTIIPLFHPPEGYEPAALQYVDRMGWQQNGWTAFTASIFDLGVKGLVTIDKSSKTLTVTPTDQTLSSRAGSPVSATLATFLGAPGTTASTYSASIDWGDGRTSRGTLTPGQLNSYAVTGSHTYAEPGWYRVAVTVSDGERTATAEVGVTVAVAAMIGKSQ